MLSKQESGMQKDIRECSTEDVPIIPHPNIAKIQADCRKIFEQLGDERVSQPGKRLTHRELVSGKY